MTSRVLVLYAGGTIGMAPSPDGLRPMDGFAERLHAALAEDAHRLPYFDVQSLEHPIDSAQLRPGDWSAIAAPLIAQWDAYDGFVILHGTDTLAWTASALSFLLMGTDKPVILTGAQIPWLQARSDALGNVHAALQFAAQREIREVAVCFGRTLMRGNRCRKRASSDFDAFDSPNAPALARIGIDLQIDERALLSPPERDFRNPPLSTDTVELLTVHPGLSGRRIDALSADPAVRGLILLSYGVGNLPSDDATLSAALERAAERELVVLNLTQCWQGRVAQDTYASGAALSRLGVIDGADLTPEAAFAKLHYLLAVAHTPAQVRARLRQPLCGEMRPG